MVDKESMWKNRALKIIQMAGQELSKIFEVNGGFLTIEEAPLYFTLCFYPDYKIKFIKNEGNTMFTSDDIWWNGDIEIGVGTDISWEELAPSSLINRIAFRLENRQQLEKKIIGKYIPDPFNMQINRWAVEEFSMNVITAKSELEEFGNTKMGAIYKNFLHDGEVKTKFFDELKKLYKRKIWAEF